MAIHFYTCEDKAGSEKFEPVSNYAKALGFAVKHHLRVVEQTWEHMSSKTVDDFTNPKACCCCGIEVPPYEELSFEGKPICEDCFDVVD